MAVEGSITNPRMRQLSQKSGGRTLVKARGVRSASSAAATANPVATLPRAQTPPKQAPALEALREEVARLRAENSDLRVAWAAMRAAGRLLREADAEREAATRLLRKAERRQAKAAEKSQQAAELHQDALSAFVMPSDPRDAEGSSR